MMHGSMNVKFVYTVPV